MPAAVVVIFACGVLIRALPLAAAVVPPRSTSTRWSTTQLHPSSHLSLSSPTSPSLPAPSPPATTSTSTSTTSSNPLTTARSLVLLQLLSRLLTFTLNQTLLRLASPSVFGTAAIQFDLVCSSILFLSREGIRNALLRRNGSEGGDSGRATGGVGETPEQVHALSLVPLQLGVGIATLIGGVYLYTSSETTTSQPTFHVSLALYILSALLELSIEPYYIRIHRASPPKLNVRVQAEGGMAIVKAAVTVGSLVGLGSNRALLGFALGQLAGAVWLAGRYVREFGWDVSSLFLLVAQRAEGKPKFDPQTLSLAMANTGQSVIKHLLTEADRLAVAQICPLHDQGGYAVAMNYGSLIARIVFQPLEESLLLHYSTSLSAPSTLPLFTLTIRLASYFTLLMPAFAIPLFPALSPLILPRQYQSTTAPSILKLYLTTYIPLLSFNGVAEAFHTASADPSEVKLQARWMVASSAVFASSLLCLSALPTVYITTSAEEDPRAHTLGKERALVLASCAAMLVRIFYALRHAYRVFAMRKPSMRVLDLLPGWKSTVWVGSVGWGLWLLRFWGRWETGWKGLVELVGVGAVLGVVSLVIIYRAESQRLHNLRSSMKFDKTD
ncbi:hypothetical protein IAT38_000136 [Cryptococcus sp. DSM 104549]